MRSESASVSVAEEADIVTASPHGPWGFLRTRDRPPARALQVFDSNSHIVHLWVERWERPVQNKRWMVWEEATLFGLVGQNIHQYFQYHGQIGKTKIVKGSLNSI